jgi:mannose-1-phosphate guanylyltransferase/phosphomannomutase
MPNVLSHLGADVLALNPYASTAGMMQYDRDLHADRVASQVRTSGAQLGAVIDPDGERLTLVDDSGRHLSDTEALLALITLVSPRLLGDRIAVPVTTSVKAESITAPHGVQVLPTKVSSAALMDASREPGVGFAADGHGGFILPGFLPAFDAAATLVKLLELLALRDEPLSEVVAHLPRVHLAHETIVTPWEQKGAVMRSLVELAKDRELVLVDGVKVLHDEGWALALPDPDEPVTHVWAEGRSDSEARQLAQEYARRIRQTLR